MTLNETIDYLTEEELISFLAHIWSTYPATRCETCPEANKCLGYHDEAWEMDLPGKGAN